MTYKIISKRQDSDTLFTTVEYNFDGVILTIDVPHFQPQSVKEVITGIENRGVSEERKLNAVKLITETIIPIL